MAKIGFIGVGNMGYAMLKGLVNIFPKEDIIITDADAQKMVSIAKELDIQYVESNAELANAAKYIIMAVKPQYYNTVIKNIQNVIKRENVMISIAPGISIKDLQDGLGFDSRIVRAMPNTPALLGEGMTGISYDAKLFTFEEKDVIEKIFKSFGKVKIVEERLMSAVVCASGSSPAYVYMFIEALADGAVMKGLPRDVAYEMVAQTVMGAAKMVLETKQHPGQLKDAVCSPGGTTMAAVAALEANGFRNCLIKATEACYDKAEGIKK